MSVLRCFDDNGEFNIELYLKEKKKRRAASLEEQLECCMVAAAEEESIEKSRKRPTRDTRGQMPKKVLEDGTIVPLEPQETIWWTLYVSNPALSNTLFRRKFRRRFRMPYEQYLELLEDVKSNELFRQWLKKDATGKQASPLELLLLGTLRYLGRGFTFDDLEENTAISEETHRRFFHVFIEFGSTCLFNEYVVAPASAEMAETHQHEFREAGMPGCVGSTDATTHIAMLRCPSQLRNYNMGHKLDLPT